MGPMFVIELLNTRPLWSMSGRSGIPSTPGSGGTSTSWSGPSVAGSPSSTAGSTSTDAAPARGAGRPTMSDKIHPHHLQRRAILYVRQSSAFQAAHHLEGQKLQYAMRARLQQLGWSDVEVVDEDLGRSASGHV